MKEEKRRFFRINDQVNLLYRLVDETQLTQPFQFDRNLLENCSLTNALNLIHEESSGFLNKIEKSLPDVADYLNFMNMKIDLISQAVLRLHGEELQKDKTIHANLSAAGVSFNCAEALRVGQYIELKMLLVQSTTIIITHAKIIYCKKNHQHNLFTVGLEFINLSEEDRELILKHVAKKQLQQIREKKAANLNV